MTVTPPTDGLDTGNLAQIGSFAVAALAFLLSFWSMWRANNKAELDALSKKIDSATASARANNKAELDALSQKIDSGNATVRDDIKALRVDDSRAFQRIDELEADVSGIKSDIRHLPTISDVHDIDLKLARQDEMLAGIKSVCEGLAGSVKSIERAMLEREAREK